MIDYDAIFAFTNGSPFPDAAGIDSTTPLTADGTEFIAKMINDNWGHAQALLNQVGMTPDGADEVAAASQRLEAIVRLVSLGVLFVDSGAADAYVLAASSSIQDPTAYYDGMQIVFLADNANTGATTVNVAALGAKDVRLNGGAVLPVNAIRTNAVTVARYNLSAGYFELENVIDFASKTEQEAGNETAKSVSPATQQDHKSAAKAWCNFTGTGVITLDASYNISALVDEGAGQYSFSFDTDFADTDYAFSGGVYGSPLWVYGSTVKAVGSMRIHTIDGGGTLSDAPDANVAFFGVQ